MYSCLKGMESRYPPLGSEKVGLMFEKRCIVFRRHYTLHQYLIRPGCVEYLADRLCSVTTSCPASDVTGQRAMSSGNKGPTVPQGHSGADRLKTGFCLFLALPFEWIIILVSDNC